MTAPQALLVDMDGTIVDSEPYWIETEGELVAEFGGTWTADDAHSVVGFALIDAAVELRDRGGVDLEPEAIVARLLDRVIERCGEHLPWRPGARDLLIEARDAGVPCVLVTMSWRRFADAVIDAAPDGVFVGSVTGDEVVNGKPAPDPYLAGAALLGLDPSECVAIEDSPTGVASALAAGCRTLAVPHVVDVEPQAGVTIWPDGLVGRTLADLATV
ncbi:HAD family hydrolase [Ilumatobacter coccineus]|uniref:Putative hydrolase n=1 Tax=Ilumatobacter coccineus (strain NBRC 103263 / KCTC 29153 / YM16-304) TaxID=1313172 RepID=A0A6C7EGA9_ILUCY|nr:HAD family phosphatase [Ilumatobacter coccineus]BAN04025.1 putative hydrolase [Ilumatobacter coccineus YM16-304]